MAETSQQRSALKDFLASIATIKGDLSNITAPPFVLAPHSTTELPLYWAEHPSLFTAPASAPDPGARLLAVLKWFLLSLPRQQYGGRDPSQGVKKPLNAFLGELFAASFGTGDDQVVLLAEQVSHHPPVTACSLRADNKGVRADGFAAQRVTFSGSVHVLQMGHAVLSLAEHGEEYVVPLPAVKISGVLTGSPYPELEGHYVLPCSSGWRAEIDFSGTKMLGFSGEKHHVYAAVYGPDGKEAVWEAEGTWTGKITVKDAQGKEVDSYDAAQLAHDEPQMPDVQEQSPYESRRAWQDVRQALLKGDMQAAADAKTKVEEAQRSQRAKREKGESGKFEPLFFKKVDRDERWEKMKGLIPDEQRKGSLDKGFWVVDEKNKDLKRPFREGVPWEG